MMFQNQRSNMIFTSVSGHLLTHEFTGKYTKWQGCNPLELFDAPVRKQCIKNMENIKVN